MLAAAYVTPMTSSMTSKKTLLGVFGPIFFMWKWIFVSIFPKWLFFVQECNKTAFFWHKLDEPRFLHDTFSIGFMPGLLDRMSKVLILFADYHSEVDTDL